MTAIHIDMREVASLAKGMKGYTRQMPLAVARAMNHTGNIARTQAVRQVAKQMGIPVGRAREEIETKLATKADLSYELTARGKFISLRAFGARETTKGVSARPWGKRRTFRGTFTIDSLGGQVFKRTSEGRLKKLWGPAIPVEFVRDEVPKIVEDTIAERFPARLMHEIARTLPKVSGR